MQEPKTSISRLKVKNGKTLLENDPLAVEEPLQIRLKQASTEFNFTITLRTPGNDIELITGLLFSEGIIEKATDIKSITQQVDGHFSANVALVELNETLKLELNNSKRQGVSHSGCGFCGKTSLNSLALQSKREQRPVSVKMSPSLIKDLRKALSSQSLFSQTGGSHVAGLVYQTDKSFQIAQSPFFEDVGRHNALDKLIGHELNQNDLGQTGILILSGRIGFELVQKSVIAGFTVIVALGAPSSLAVQSAKQFNIALIGFAKDNSFNLYTADESLLALT